MKEIGQIIEATDDKVKVRIDRHSLCSKCTNNCHLAGETHEKEEFEVVVDNRLGARKGQLVRLELSEESLVTASLIIYLIPLLSLILGYYAGSSLAPFLGFNGGEGSGIISSIVFLLLSFILVRYFDKVLGKKKRFQPQLIEIVSENTK